MVEVHDQGIARLSALDVERARLRVPAFRHLLPAGIVPARVDGRRDDGIPVGDGHAVQGAGEIVGTGIEVSFDVQLTVHLLKGHRIDWPRGENTDYIFTVGNARPLDQALQHATTEMGRWLADDYGLDMLAASILLGQCVEYDVGNVFDPAYTMVCKVPKRVLPARAEP